MRFSISASISTSWRRRSSCSRSSGVPCSRSGSVGGSSASSRRTCVSSCCCVLLQLLDLLSASPRWRRRARSAPKAAAARSRGRLAASPPPARLACAIACAFSGASPERELTRMTSSGESSNIRLKPSGSTKRTPSSAPWKAIETPSATCSVEIRVGSASLTQARRRSGRRSTPALRRDVDGERERAGAVGVVVVGRGLRVGAVACAPARRRDARSTEAATSSVSRSIAPTRTRTALPRPSCSAPTARKTSGSVSARTRPSFSTVGVELVDVVLHQPAQRPVALDLRLERVVGGVRRVEVGDRREQLDVLRLERRDQRRRCGRGARRRRSATG